MELIELLCRRLRTGITLALVLGAIILGTVCATETTTCAGCHQAPAQHQPETPMAHALLPAGENPTLKSHPTLTVNKGQYAYTIKTAADGQSVYTVSDGINTLALPIRWTMGQHMQTWVFERTGRYFESFVSYYPGSDRIDTTVGDEKLSPQTLEEAVGREISPREAKECFGCHSSNSVVKGELVPESLQPGVTCGHCHQGSTEHVVDAMQGSFESKPPRLKDLSAEDINTFCGQCHRSWETVIRTGIRGAANVRFQPYRLENSKCFDGADRRLSCIACHDPHVPLVRDDAAYDRICLACHALPEKAFPKPVTAVGKPCPVAREKCVSCHMPKTRINSPGGLLTFTDHQIRVVKPGEPYPN